MSITIALDGVDSEVALPGIVVENVSRQIMPTVRDEYREVAGFPGSWYFPEEGGDRALSARFVFVGDTLADRRSAMRVAGRWLWSRNRRKLVVSDEPDRYWLAKAASAPVGDELLARGRFDVEFRTSPYAFATAVESESLSGSGTLTIPASLDDTDADYFVPVVEVTAGGAGLPSGFTLDVDGVALTYGAAVGANAKITVSSVVATVFAGANVDVELDGTNTGAVPKMTSVSGDFPKIAPGDNVVTFTGGTATLDFYYRRLFV